MKITFPLAGVLLGASLLPAIVYSADPSTPSVPSSANETATMTVPKDRHGTASQRSAHPIDDASITTKIKGKFLKDSQVRADNIEIKTLDGRVELFGTARTQAKAKHAVALARTVGGVKSVTNNITVDSANTQAEHSKPNDGMRATGPSRSHQPVDDSWITTKVKAKLVEDKQVKAHNIHVKTVDGVVELSGTADSKAESSKAASLARSIKGVKSVNNDIRVN